MDHATMSAYDHDAKAFADEWEGQPAPSDLHAMIQRFFIPGPTADIGCGSGRDTAWLNTSGFPTTGFEASDGLLTEARRRHPNIDFRKSALPDLEGIAHESFSNVLCETVIMHLEHAVMTPAVTRLVSILVTGGILCLSWRVTEGADTRDRHGRLYAAFEPERVLLALTATQVLLDHQADSISSGKSVRRIVARKV
jgi:trans-aconitate methyltransferase